MRIFIYIKLGHDTQTIRDENIYLPENIFMRNTQKLIGLLYLIIGRGKSKRAL